MSTPDSTAAELAELAGALPPPGTAALGALLRSQEEMMAAIEAKGARLLAEAEGVIDRWFAQATEDVGAQREQLAVDREQAEADRRQAAAELKQAEDERRRAEAERRQAAADREEARRLLEAAHAEARRLLEAARRASERPRRPDQEH